MATVDHSRCTISIHNGERRAAAMPINLQVGSKPEVQIPNKLIVGESFLQNFEAGNAAGSCEELHCIGKAHTANRRLLGGGGSKSGRIRYHEELSAVQRGWGSPRRRTILCMPIERTRVEFSQHARCS